MSSEVTRGSCFLKKGNIDHSPLFGYLCRHLIVNENGGLSEQV